MTDERIIEHSVDTTIENLFSVAINGLEYGITRRIIVPPNNGEFEIKYVNSILDCEMYDDEFYDVIGSIGADYIMENIPKVCKLYLSVMDNTGGEVGFIRNEFPEVYENIRTSLNNIVKNHG